MRHKTRAEVYFVGVCYTTATIAGVLLIVLSLTGIAHCFSATMVADANGRLIGEFIPTNVGQVLLKPVGVWASAPLSIQGWVEAPIFLEYASPDCSGQAYVLVTNDRGFVFFLSDSGLVNGTLYFGDPAKAGAICYASFKGLGPGTNGQCQTQSPCFTDNAAPMMTFNLDSLGYVPPFKLMR